MDTEKVLQISHLEKSFGTHEVLRDIDFTVNKGEAISIIGPSGSGKSTLLRCVNLLETPTGGNIYYHGKDITDAKMNIPSYREHVGMVFQNFNLFANMTVLENCMTGPVTVAKKSKKRGQRSGNQILEKGWNGAVYQCQAEAVIGRTEAACCHCACTCHGTGSALI